MFKELWICIINIFFVYVHSHTRPINLLKIKVTASFGTKWACVSVTEQLIEAGCSTDLQTKDGATVAVHNGHASVTKQLIKARCNIDLLSKDGYTHSCPGC
jgi:hypothetical protein